MFHIYDYQEIPSVVFYPCQQKISLPHASGSLGLPKNSLWIDVVALTLKYLDRI